LERKEQEMKDFEKVCDLAIHTLNKQNQKLKRDYLEKITVKEKQLKTASGKIIKLTK